MELPFIDTNQELTEDEIHLSNWMKSRGLISHEYQKDILLNKLNKLIPNSTPIVLAACPSAGKTIMSIYFIEKFLRDNPGKRVLVLTHGTGVLRLQYEEEVEKIHPDFNYEAIKSSNDFKNCKSQVVITLPQTISRLHSLPHFDLIIIDEAHHFYFTSDGMVQKIIKKTTPKYQLLLTGTPSQFIRKKYTIIPVTVNQLLDYNMVSDLMVEISSSAYDFNQSDYNQQNDLKLDVQIKQEDTINTLDQLLDNIIKRLKSIFKNNPEKYFYINNITGWSLAFQSLGKTMIACKNQEQAKQVKKYFDNKNIDSAISISDTEGADAKEIIRFKSDKNCKILIVVVRGILGFNLPELENVIDMTASQNIDRIFQLMCRVIRKHPKGNQKLFFKIVPKYLESYFQFIMECVVCLTDEQYYMQYNGKNFANIAIPVTVVRKNPALKTKSINKNTKKREVKAVEFMGLPVIQLFKDILHKNNEIFNSYAYTTMQEIKSIFVNKVFNKGYWTEETIRECALTCKTRKEFSNKYISAYGAARKLGILDLVCQHMTDVLTYWTDEDLQEKALLYKTRIDFLHNDRNAYTSAKTKGILDAICTHMESQKHEPWNEKTIHEVALKCETPREFKKNYPTAYNAAQKEKILDIVCSHMKFRKERWTEEKIRDTAKPYKLRIEFQKNCGSAYQAAIRLGILDSVCSHMKYKSKNFKNQHTKKSK